MSAIRRHRISRLCRASQWVLLAASMMPGVAFAQGLREPDWGRLQDEAIQHYQALLRMDTSDPPGNERPAAEYLELVLERDGIPAQLLEAEPNRVNLVARLKGNGKRRPLLIMAHTDVVNVDPTKWTFPPFSATRDAGYVYGRGTLDDKDNVVAALMTMLTLKRMNVPLDRDVIFLIIGCSRTSHAIHPCCGRRSRPTSSARASGRQEPRRGSTRKRSKRLRPR